MKDVIKNVSSLNLTLLVKRTIYNKESTKEENDIPKPKKDQNKEVVQSGPVIPTNCVVFN